MSANLAQPRVIFINQWAGPLFTELVEDVTRQVGPTWLISGLVETNQSHNPDLVIKKAPAYNRSNILMRLYTWTLFLIVAFKEVLRCPPTAPLVVASNPPFMPWLAMLVHRIRRQPYIVLIYDIYPNMAVQLGYFPANHWLVKLWRGLNRLAYRRAARLVTIGEHMAKVLEGYLAGENGSRPVDVIPTWVDTDRFRPLEKSDNPFASQVAQVDKLTVLYSGNLGLAHDIRIVLEAATRLRSDTDLHFLIIGDGQRKEALVEKAITEELENVTFLPLQPKEVLPYSLAAGDVAIVSIAQGIEGLMMPSKTYYAMAVGSALVSISQPPNDLADVIERYACGENVLPNDVEGLVDVLKRFQANPDYLNRRRASARQAAEERFSRQKNTKAFAELIESVLSV
jgi:glycosyltransferase involved in cell wall biosynthesis